MASLHSYKATDLVIQALEAQAQSPEPFSIGGSVTLRKLVGPSSWAASSQSMQPRYGVPHLLDILPLDRILTETDHPFGDRRSGQHARPGLVAVVEKALASHDGETPAGIRAAMRE